LITDYARKSPSECFAEYYSFYNLNKKTLDAYFKTNDRKYLSEHSSIVAKSVSSEQPISQMLSHRVNTMEPDVWERYKENYQQITERGREHEIVLNSPWEVKLSREEKSKLSKKTLKFRKDLSIHSMPPIIAVRDGMDRVVIDGGIRIEVAKMNKQLVPTIEISKEEYFNLRARGLSDIDIADCIYTKHENNYVPKQIAPATMRTGLVYRDHLIPIDVILDNHNGLKKMADICSSEELQKAVESVFEMFNN
jgi:hypothetical protein